MRSIPGRGAKTPHAARHGPKKKEAERALTWKRGHVMTEARCYDTGFKDKGRGPGPREAGKTALEARKGQEMNSPLEHLEGHLDFS